jgi:nitroreductase/NAD-dependent dihydropyrimidine dehydrogenase PreA subunit
MPLFSVDENKCKRDGICAIECPVGIILPPEGDATPEPTPDADELCINCGHCVAVCPHGALSLATMGPDTCPPVHKDWLLSPERVEHFLRARRSIRVYQKKPVPRETLVKLIDIARHAPSGHNTQPVRWHVIYDSTKIPVLAAQVVDWMEFLLGGDMRELALNLHMDRAVDTWKRGIDGVLRQAPHLIVAHGEKEERSAPAGCTIALTHLDLAAPSFGVGVCWAGYFTAAAQTWPPLQQMLGLPEGHQVFGTMMVGYPKFEYHRLPLRNEPVITWA